MKTNFSNFNNQIINPYKALSGLGVFVFFTLVIFSKSVYKIRFLDWGIGALLFFFLCGVIIIRRKMRRQDLLTLTLPLLWALYALFGSPFAYNTPHHLGALAQTVFLNFIATAVTIVLFSQNNKAVKAIWLTASTWTLINVCLFILWNIGAIEQRNFSGLLPDRNEFSMQTILIIGTLRMLAKKNLRVHFLTAINFILIIASQSITGFLSFFVIVFAPAFLKETLFKKIAVICIATVVGFMLIFMLPQIQTRLLRFSMILSNREELRESESAFLRFWAITEGLTVAFSNPLFGVGVDNSRFILISPYHLKIHSDTGMVAHNNYVEMLLNAGVLGFLLYYAPLLYIYIKIRTTHFFYFDIKAIIIFFLFSGISIFQYNFYMFIQMYSILVFLFLDNDKEANFHDQHTLSRKHT